MALMRFVEAFSVVLLVGIAFLLIDLLQVTLHFLKNLNFAGALKE